MEEWIFTFGFGHTHPKTGESLANTFVRIAAADSEAAREEMYRRFGQKWSFQYDSEQKAGVEKYGLRELREPA